MKAIITIPSDFSMEDIEEELKKYPINYRFIGDWENHYLVCIESKEKELFYFNGGNEPRIKRNIMEGLKNNSD